jgi:hypothetical protein
LKREFNRQGVGLIPITDGAKAMVAEMFSSTKAPAEVVIGAAFIGAGMEKKDKSNIAPLEKPIPHITAEKDNLTLLIKRELDLEQYPILSDHILGGKPVVPLALITEWIGHSALHENPGLMFHGIDSLRLLAGIKLDKDKKLVRLMAGKVRRTEEFYEVDVEIRNGKINNKDVIHSRATALLADQLPSPPQYKGPNFKSTAHVFEKTLSDIYEEVLFHGDRLKGIQTILSHSAEGMAARLATAPEPVAWMADPLRSHWILDPLVLDCAFQMAIIWCHEYVGKRCLPSFAASYRQYREGFPEKEVIAVLQVNKTNATKMIGDFNFIDPEGKVVAQLKGYEAIMDNSLEKAFGRQNAA